jgi:hypothetical protein
MKLLDLLDNHFRAVFVAASVFAAVLYLLGWTSGATALAAANATMVLVHMLRASRDPSRGSFPDGQ